MTYPDMQPISWIPFQSQEQLLAEYWSNPDDMPMAVIFQSNPMASDQQMKYG